jgi:hypothetical protein
MKKLATVFLFTLLAACATGIGETPAQKVFAATQVYDAALTAAVAYKKLPPCNAAPRPVLCSDAAVVATLQKADTVAYEALKSAQTVVRTPTATQSALQTAIAWATEAASAFSRVAAAVK